ncbi:MAG: TRAP transporter large permease [Lautropia sp.]
MDPMLTAAGVFVLGLATGMPVAFVLLGAAFFGLLAIRGFDVALSALMTMPYAKATDIGLVTIPLFILMGSFATTAGVSEKAYQMAYRFVGHLRAGLAITTVFACAAFAATSGSSVATSAAVGKIAFGEMKRFRYDDAISAGTIASAGLLGIMIPPSIMFIVYGIVTQTDIGALLLAGILPGLLTAFVFCVGLAVLAGFRPDLMPTADVRYSWGERLRGLKDGWRIALLFTIIIGGIYTGLFTATESAAVGALAAFAMAVAHRGFNGPDLLRAASEAARTCAMIFLILIGAGLFGQFVALSGLASAVSDLIASSTLSPHAILALILLMYLPLGMFLEPISMCLITLPVVVPAIKALGFDPIWFGVLIVKMCELANITPPLGVNVFVIKGIRPDIPLSTVFRGAAFFVLLEIVTLVILVAFPAISLVIPNAISK